MRVIRKIRADDGFTDVCECSELTSLVSGLSIAWLCSQLKLFQYGQCSVTIPEPADSGKVHTIQGHPKGNNPSPFIRYWINKDPVAVTVYGKYEEMQVSISVVFARNVIQIYYPRPLERKIHPLEKELGNAIDKQFSILLEQSRTDMGSRVIVWYGCPLFRTNRDGLRITATAAYCPSSFQRWIAAYRDDLAPGNEDYGLWTDRQRLNNDEFVNKYGDSEKVIKTVCALTWHGKQVEVTCDYRSKNVVITYDKWLTNEIDQFIRWMNREIYERAFPKIGPQKEKF